MSTRGPDRTTDTGEPDQAEPEVIQRVAEALEGTEAGEAPTITLHEEAEANAASLPQRGG